VANKKKEKERDKKPIRTRRSIPSPFVAPPANFLALREGTLDKKIARRLVVSAVSRFFFWGTGVLSPASEDWNAPHDQCLPFQTGSYATSTQTHTTPPPRIQHSSNSNNNNNNNNTDNNNNRHHTDKRAMMVPTLSLPAEL
jgi:hypothetical protein